MLISLETHIRTCYFPGGCPDPLSPSGSAHGQCHHNGTIFITALLTIIVTGPRSAVGNVSGYRCVSDCRSRGREFDPGSVPYFRGD